MLLQLVPAFVALCAIGAMLWLEYRFSRHDSALRRKLGACRTALEQAEAERDQATADCAQAEAQLELMYGEFQAQSGELARYRRQHAPHDRLTRIRKRAMPGYPKE